MRVVVAVTEQDIRESVPSWSACPLAKALRRAGLDVYGVTPDSWDMPGHCGLPLSRAARRFLDRFDDGLPVEPTRFIFTVPDRVSA